MSTKHIDFGAHYPNEIEDILGNTAVIHALVTPNGFLQLTPAGIVANLISQQLVPPEDVPVSQEGIPNVSTYMGGALLDANNPAAVLTGYSLIPTTPNYNEGNPVVYMPSVTLPDAGKQKKVYLKDQSTLRWNIDFPDGRYPLGSDGNIIYGRSVNCIASPLPPYEWDVVDQSPCEFYPARNLAVVQADSTQITSGSFGCSYITKDGTLLFVGYDDISGGKVRVFSRGTPGSSWSTTPVFQFPSPPPGNIGFTSFGCSISSSDDGTWVVIGGYSDNSNTGAVWVFEANGTFTSWSLISKYVGTGAAANDFFGYSVAMNRDGTVFAVGAPHPSSPGLGKVFVFQRTLGTSIFIENMSPAGFTIPYVGNITSQPDGKFGFSVAINAYGTIIRFGGTVYPFDDIHSTGAVIKWKNVGGVWTYSNIRTATGLGNNALFGYSLAMDDSGYVTFVGAPGVSSYVGAVYIMADSSIGPAIQSPTPTGQTSFGCSIATTATGNTVLIGRNSLFGSPSDTTGNAFIYISSGGFYYQQYADISQPLSNPTQHNGDCVTLDSQGKNGVVFSIDGGPGNTSSFIPIH